MSSAVRSSSSETSAKSRAGRIAVPAKMTSSIPAPRIDLGELSPITQRIASSTFDLPQPLGPTTPVRPGSTLSSAGSTKLLKPLSFSRFICTTRPPPPSPLASRRLADQRLELFPARSLGLGAVDEKGGGVADPKRIRRRLHVEQALETGRIGKALARPRRRHSEAGGKRREAGDLGQPGDPLRVGHLLDRRALRRTDGAELLHPLRLGGVDDFRHREELPRPRAMREQGHGNVRRVEDVVAELVADPAGAQIGLDERLIAGLLEMAAMGAGERAIFDELHRRRGIAHAEAALRRRDDIAGPVARRGRRPPCRSGDGRDGERGQGKGREKERRPPHGMALLSCGSSAAQLAVLSTILPLMKKVGVPVTPCLVPRSVRATSLLRLTGSSRQASILACGMPRRRKNSSSPASLTNCFGRSAAGISEICCICASGSACRRPAQLGWSAYSSSDRRKKGVGPWQRRSIDGPGSLGNSM